MDENFINLKQLLEEDNDKVLSIKTLEGIEYEYGNILEVLEETIADYYSQNRGLTDLDLKDMLRNIKQNYVEDLDFFEHDLEKEIMLELSLEFQIEPLTYHELKLIIDCITRAIDNRSFISGEANYLKWLLYYNHYYNEDEEERYIKQFIRKCKKNGLNKHEIKNLLEQKEDKSEIFNPDMIKSNLEFFKLNNYDEKDDYLLNNFEDYPFLLNLYLLELLEAEELERIKMLADALSERYPEHSSIHFLSAAIILNTDIDFTKRHLVEAKIKIKDLPEEKKLLKNIRLVEKKLGL
jgi:DNA-binding transcriptional MerR regulator